MLGSLTSVDERSAAPALTIFGTCTGIISRCVFRVPVCARDPVPFLYRIPPVFLPVSMHKQSLFEPAKAEALPSPAGKAI